MVQRWIGKWGTCDGASLSNILFAGLSELGVFAFRLINLTCFLKAVDSVRLLGWLSPGFLKITIAVMFCLTWDGPDRMHANFVMVTAAVSFDFSANTDLASVYIFFGVTYVCRL